jgi:hypothetical protein
MVEVGWRIAMAVVGAGMVVLLFAAGLAAAPAVPGSAELMAFLRSSTVYVPWSQILSAVGVYVAARSTCLVLTVSRIAIVTTTAGTVSVK